MCTKTEMLFYEWKELFNLAHDDTSKQQAIIDRKKSLEKLLGVELTDTEDEYLALFALQTAYAIVIKVIAYKLISQIRFDESLISFDRTMQMESEQLRVQFSRLENGAIFREYGLPIYWKEIFFRGTVLKNSGIKIWQRL